MTVEEVTRQVYTETEVGKLLGVHRTTVRAQALQGGNVLGQCVIHLTPTKRVYPRAAIDRLVGVVTETDREKVA